MIRAPGSNAGGGNLTPAQREILAHFDAMTEEAQHSVTMMLASVAKYNPRQRPKLRVVGGRVA